jgi:hypothetical protein
MLLAPQMQPVYNCSAHSSFLVLRIGWVRSVLLQANLQEERRIQIVSGVKVREVIWHFGEVIYMGRGPGHGEFLRHERQPTDLPEPVPAGTKFAGT